MWETGGFHSRTDALLQLAAVIVKVDGAGARGSRRFAFPGM